MELVKAIKDVSNNGQQSTILRTSTRKLFFVVWIASSKEPNRIFL